VFACACYRKQSFTFKGLSENRRKFKKYKKSVFVWIRAPAAILPAKSPARLLICKLQKNNFCRAIGRKFRLPGTDRASQVIQGGTASVGGLMERRALALTFRLPGEDRRTIDLNIQPNQVSRERICKRLRSPRIDSASLFIQRRHF
jgi:hypothetical protein